MKLPKTRWSSRLFTFTCFVLMTLSAHAQFTSSLQGNVQDSTGAVIPGASITLENTETQVINTATSDGQGRYTLLSLAPGTYVLKVSAKGFGKAELSVTLNSGQSLNAPVTLGVQKLDQSVTVEGRGPILNTEETRSQDTMETQALTSLPLQGRSMVGLVTMAPGATGLGLEAGGSPGSAADNYSTETQVDASANGRGSVNNLYIVDGLDVTSVIRPGVLNLTPNPDSTQEQTTEVNNYSVDYARGASLIMRITTASGTEKYHGSASEYYTTEQLWAKTDFSAAPYNPFHTNNMSATFGGPIVPHHEAFAFASVEPLRSAASTGDQSITFEDPAFTAWAKSAYPNSIGTSVLSGFAPSLASGAKVSQTANDVFPGTCGTAATNFLPCATPMIDNGAFNSTNFRNGTQYNVRGDKYFHSDRAYGNFYRTLLDTGSGSYRPGLSTTNHYTQWSLQGNETHTFSPKTLNEVSVSFNRIEGIAPETGDFKIPSINVNGINGIGDGFAHGDFTQKNYHWRDVLTHIKGSHEIRIGYDGLKPDDIADFSGAYAQPTFNFTNLLNLVQDAPYQESGVSYDPLTGKQKKWFWSTTEVTAGAFFEDTWKATRSLTLKMGVRWDDFGNPYGIGNVQTPNFHLGSGQTLNQQIANGSMLSTGHILNNAITNVVSPRFGFAWSPGQASKLVIRGGYGLYRQWPTLGNLDNSLVDNPPNYIFPVFKAGTAVSPIFNLGTTNTAPFGFTYPSLAGISLDSKGGLPGYQISIGGEDPNLKAPYTSTYSVTVERQLIHSITGSVGYAGSHSMDLMTGSGQQSATSYGVDINRFAGDLIQNMGVQTRLNQSFGAITWSQNLSKANYNALIIAANGRFAKRGFLMVSYTRSESKDNTQVYPSADPMVPQYYGPSVWDAPNRFSLVWNYNLPEFSGGKGLLGRASGGWGLSGNTIFQSGYPFTIVNYNPLQPVISGGVITGLQPTSGDYNADGDNLDYPNVSSYKQLSGRKDFLTGVFGSYSPSGQYANISTPLLGTEGNEQYDGFRGPGYFGSDVSLLKTTNIWERASFQFRVDFFNIFNHPNLYNVDGSLFDGNFGHATSQYNPRYLQFGAKIQF